ncbi:hypothetical protein LY78DRAFT_480780 [Colletotrichum sublineola]|nr:hypothetical protein LY78DRAFT_480780 [Colletotrichum sublineola]
MLPFPLVPHVPPQCIHTPLTSTFTPTAYSRALCLSVSVFFLSPLSHCFDLPNSMITCPCSACLHVSSPSPFRPGGVGAMENGDPQIFLCSPLLQSPFRYPSSSSYGDRDVPSCPLLSRSVLGSCSRRPSLSARWVARLVCLSLNPASPPFRSPGYGHPFSSVNDTTVDCFFAFVVNISRSPILALFFSFFAIPQLYKGSSSFHRRLEFIEPCHLSEAPKAVDT